MERSKFNDLSLNEMFAMINRLQKENAELQKFMDEEVKVNLDAFYKEIERSKRLKAKTIDELCADMPEGLDDDFTPDMKH